MFKLKQSYNGVLKITQILIAKSPLNLENCFKLKFWKCKPKSEVWSAWPLTWLLCSQINQEIIWQPNL